MIMSQNKAEQKANMWGPLSIQTKAIQSNAQGPQPLQNNAYTCQNMSFYMLGMGQNRPEKHAPF